MKRDLPFDHEGFQAVQAELELFADDLAAEAARIAIRRQAGVISDKYVLEAAARLNRDPRPQRDYHLAAAGVIGGGAIGGTVSMAISEDWPAGGVIVCVALGLVAMFLFGYCWHRT